MSTMRVGKQPEIPALRQGRPQVTLADVKEFLMQRPEALADDLMLLSRIIPGVHEENGTVRDFQRCMIDRLSAQVADLHASNEAIMEATRMNAQAQLRVHEAVLALLEARTFDHFVETVTQEVPSIIGVDRIVLCVEDPRETRALSTDVSGVHILPHGTIDRIVPPDQDVSLRNNIDSEDSIFGLEAGEVHSEALLRLRFSPSAPAGLLAVGAQEPDVFDPEQGVDLLNFLARAVERSVQTWLDLPSR